MPVHDWSRVDAGIFHDFHTRWITHIAEGLNDGLLPDHYYALAEQRSGQVQPDVITLKTADDSAGTSPPEAGGAVALADAPPIVTVTMRPDVKQYALRRRTLTIRHASGDRIVALIEIVSKANKDRESTVHEFAEKVVSALSQAVHVLVVDVVPPGPHDPTGMHGAIWHEIDEAQPYNMPADKPLTLASYFADAIPVAYVEPIGLGAEMPAMPLFLHPDWYVRVPLEETYRAAYHGVPRRWREVIEG
jgi:hypothetical protein